MRAHVERCLQDIWRVAAVQPDDDGDYPFRHGCAAGFVRVETQEPMLVRVFAHAVYDVPRSSKLLAELNDINARARSAHAHLTEGTLVVEQALLATSFDRDALAHACRAVGTVADDVAPLVSVVYGGRTPYPMDTSVDET